MARPRKGEEKDRPVHLGFRVPEWVYAGLQRLAGERGGPMSDLAYEALVAYLKRYGIKEEPGSAAKPESRSRKARRGARP